MLYQSEQQLNPWAGAPRRVTCQLDGNCLTPPSVTIRPDWWWKKIPKASVHRSKNCPGWHLAQVPPYFLWLLTLSWGEVNLSGFNAHLTRRRRYIIATGSFALWKFVFSMTAHYLNSKCVLNMNLLRNFILENAKQVGWGWWIKPFNLGNFVPWPGVGLGEWMKTWVALNVGWASRALSHSTVRLHPFKKIIFKVKRRSSQNQSGQ